MPEPIQGRQDQRYLYEAAVSWYAYAAQPSVGISLTLPAPEPSEPQNVLLHKIAAAVYQIFGGTPPPAPCGDNVCLKNIAQNISIPCSVLTVGQGRPDQVYAYIIDASLYVLAQVNGITPLLAEPNQGDPINRLYQKMASLSYEISALGSPVASCGIPPPPPPPPPTPPPQVDPLALFAPDMWLDGADASTLTLTGSALSKWQDKSGRPETIGSGRDATMLQPDTSKQPTVSVDAYGKNLVNLTTAQSMKSGWSIIDFTIGFGYTGPGMFAGIGNFDPMADLNVGSGLFRDDSGSPNHFLQASLSALGVVEILQNSGYSTSDEIISLAQRASFRDTPTWLDTSATVEVATYSNKHTDGSGIHGVMLYGPRTDKKSFFYFKEVADLVGQWPVIWSYGDLGTDNGYPVGIRELCYTLGAKTDADCRAYLISLYGKWLWDRVSNFVFFLGDSITYGDNLAEADSYPYQVMQVVGGGLAADYINAGLTGRTLVEMATDQPYYTPLFRPYRQNVMVVMGGINDMWASVGSHVTNLANLWAICDAMRAAGFKVVVCTIIPAPNGANPPGYQNTQPERIAYNNAIRSGWTAHADGLADTAALSQFNFWGVDLTAPTLTYQGGTYQQGASFENMTYYQNDNVHPTAAGALLLAQCINPVVAYLI